MEPDFTLVCYDADCECALWKDNANGGLLYRDFSGNDFFCVLADTFGVTQRVGYIRRLLGLENPEEDDE